LDKKQNAKVALTQEQTIEMIKRAAAKASNVYIATDPDREGEGIA
jgi:DNA topoisomerase IA